jgi:hypothetical protein
MLMISLKKYGDYHGSSFVSSGKALIHPVRVSMKTRRYLGRVGI